MIARPFMISTKWWSMVACSIKECGFQPCPALGEVLTKIEYAIVDGELANEKKPSLPISSKRRKNERSYCRDKLTKSVGDKDAFS